MLAEICEAAGINLKEVAAVFAGPPCETYSPADACNISRGNEYRNHADANKGPRGWSTVHCEADKLKRERAILHDNMITNVIRSIVEERKHNEFEVVLENPVGSLKKRPFMQTEEWKELTDLKTVDYCAYGAEVRKSTNIWTTMRDWTSRGKTVNGRCKCCEHTGEKQHAKVIAGNAERSFKGPEKMQQI